MMVVIVSAIVTGSVCVIVGWLWLLRFAWVDSIPARVLLAVTCTAISLAAFWFICASVAITVNGLMGARI